MDDKELAKHGVVGCRKSLNDLLRSKVYDVFMIILIILYTLLVFLYFGIEGTTFLI